VVKSPSCHCVCRSRPLSNPVIYMPLHHSQCIITSHLVCYYITPTMLLHHTQYVIASHPLCYYVPHTQNVITSHPVCYYITPNMLLHHTHCVITSHPICYYITPNMLLHHTHYVITSHTVCYYITPNMLLHHTHCVITSHPICYYITPTMLLHHTHCVITYLTPYTMILNSQLTIQLTYIIILIFKYTSANYLTDVAIALLTSCLIRFLKLKEEISLLYSYIAGNLHLQITSSIFKCCLLFKSQRTKIT